MLEIANRRRKYNIELLFRGPGLDADGIFFAVLRLKLLEC
jgi:hypothetical protein